MKISRLVFCFLIGLAACADSKSNNSAETESSAPAGGLIQGTPDGDLDRWVADIRTGIAPLAAEARTDGASAQSEAVNLYATRQEYIEMYYGPGGRLKASAALGTEIESAEARFHDVMKLLGAKPVDATAVESAIQALDAQQARVLEVWRKGKTRLDRDAIASTAAVVGGTSKLINDRGMKTNEIRSIVASFNEAAQAYSAGDSERARKVVLDTYLDQFEPIESRLPSSVTGEIEHLIHVEIRPAMERAAPREEVTALLNAVNAELVTADTHLAKGSSFWFAAINSFFIIVREGLEAVLLIGALLGYLAATGASARHRRQIFTGVAAGIAVSLVTWAVAGTLIPINGANRELIEGITALVAVGVLLYVSNWLFQKTYIHDWKNYLRERLNAAVSSKSAFAMMLLSFAAVYREGFETVLFYQALIFDASAAAVLSGFIPGMILIIAVGVLIIRAGAKLPLKQMFAVTNSILVYLAFVFVGKGVYNLHEAGVFAAHQLPLPDTQILRLVFGWYPLLETNLAQAAYLTLIGATFMFYKRKVARAQLAPQATRREKIVA